MIVTKDPSVSCPISEAQFTLHIRDEPAGNSNAGHVYGSNLSDDDRMALLELLKAH